MTCGRRKDTKDTISVENADGQSKSINEALFSEEKYEVSCTWRPAEPTLLTKEVWFLAILLAKVWFDCKS